jgi:hypothetical protein
MKNLIKKILREGFDWIQDNSISGEELEELIRKTGATSIPFDRVSGDLNLVGTKIQSLGNLQNVGGYLDLRETPIKDLGNLQSVGGDLDLRETKIQSLGNLQSVGSHLYLYGTKIQSLGNLQSVGGYLYLVGTPISKKYSEEQIRQMVQVNGNIYL